MNVEKRDGRIVSFDKTRITNALQKCFATVHNEITGYIILIDNLTDEITKRLNKSTVKVEEIQDIVEEVLIANNYPQEAKEYILYRNTRNKQRNAKNRLTNILKNVISDKSTSNDLKRENANIDADTSMGTMLKIGSETSKDYSLNYLIDPKFAQEHIDGDIHIHGLIVA